ncbi:hypothetical protein VE01_07166 [Pseudogymnoascus verrucosus]|uniref:Cellobiose dehydrogenase-like cytochrome domain-containing protein n=1 Tax=Pseudogymnoascus verrucosus TaxID=342668 RepID=A0A1B8GE28_9PEZI|nr:uncharacterized protein VE01_07166 [Pseudogymnoascus verrucosus]OBT94086.1 hypothetical protein VE01_07166 [Pseudogymnoascus verrucosus]
MAHSSAYLFLGLVLSTLTDTTVAQKKGTTAFTDPNTGISFQRFFGAKTTFGFGIALPTEPTTDFIGQLTFPLNGGNGWGGFSMTGDMEGPLLLAAWSDGAGNVISSFRQAENEDDNPPEVTGSFAIRPIAKGTSVSNTFLTYTFLCEGCLDAAFGLGAADTAGDAEMGWALAKTAVGGPETSAGILGFHDSGFGDFTASLGLARSAEFATWAALAGAPIAPAAGAVPIQANAGDGDDGDDDDDDDDDDEGGASNTGGGSTGGNVGAGTVLGGATTGGGNVGGGAGGDDSNDDDSDDED